MYTQTGNSCTRTILHHGAGHMSPLFLYGEYTQNVYFLSGDPYRLSQEGSDRQTEGRTKIIKHLIAVTLCLHIVARVNNYYFTIFFSVITYPRAYLPPSAVDNPLTYPNTAYQIFLSNSSSHLLCDGILPRRRPNVSYHGIREIYREYDKILWS